MYLKSAPWFVCKCCVLALAVAGCSSSSSSKRDAAVGTDSGAGDDAADVQAADVGAKPIDASAEVDGGGAGFVHPGLLHTQADFDRMATKVAAKASPWIDGWNKLVANAHASLTWTPHPVASLHRNDGTNPDNYMGFANDVAAAYACALRWKVTGDSHYADKAVEIMNAWSGQLTEITWIDGHYDGWLLAGIQGYQFANVGEIMRTYQGLSAADFERFKTMMTKVFNPFNVGIFSKQSSLSVYSNWDLCAMAAALAVAVLTDDRAQFDVVMDYFKTGLGNGAVNMTVYYLHPGYFGQTQESSRDQGHDTLSIMLISTIAEMAWNQGVDLYGYDNNRLLAGAEYVAKGNLKDTNGAFYTMPFAPYTNGGGWVTSFATGSQGAARPEWTLIYNHYVNRKGLAAPHTQQFMELTSPEGGGGDYGPNSGGYDQLGYGTLAFSRDPIAAGAPPSGLTAFASQGNVTLSWWGTAYATGYTVKRATHAGGPYAPVATDIKDLLSYTDAPAAGTYFYVVTATTPTGETSASNEVKAVTDLQLHTQLKFDETSGTVASDASGNGHSARLMGGATWTKGKSGNAVSLDGKGSYVSLPDDFMRDVGDFTIAAWVWLNSKNSGSRVFDFGLSSAHYMALIPLGGGNVARFTVTNNSNVGEVSAKSSSALPTGRWVHVAVTLADKAATFYVDGAAVGTQSEVWLSPFQVGHTTQNWIGRSQYAADPTLDGIVDDFRIYRGAMTADQVLTLSKT